MDQKIKILALEALVTSLLKESYLRSGLPYEAVFDSAHQSLANNQGDEDASEKALATNYIQQLKQQMKMSLPNRS